MLTDIIENIKFYSFYTVSAYNNNDAQLFYLLINSNTTRKIDSMFIPPWFTIQWFLEAQYNSLFWKNSTEESIVDVSYVLRFSSYDRV